LWGEKSTIFGFSEEALAPRSSEQSEERSGGDGES